MNPAIAFDHTAAIWDEHHPVNLPRSVYLHLPFCAHKCGYCDFATVTQRDHAIDDYLTALDCELSLYLKPATPIDTIFVGGGTPTYPSVTQLERFCQSLHHWFQIQPHTEFTMEANPETVTAEKVDLLHQYGVNRISLGVQSFQAAQLATLDRQHRPETVQQAVELVQPLIPNYSLDFIFGIPDQTADAWQQDLQLALALQPSHLSLYNLTYEKGTKLWKARADQHIRPLPEELEMNMFATAIEELCCRGWVHYEISNFHAPADQVKFIPAAGSFACQHNYAYWKNYAYYGFGLGAASYCHGIRAINYRTLNQYLQRLERLEKPVQDCEQLTPEARARETAFLRLRLLAGIHFQEFATQTGFTYETLLQEHLQPFLADGLLELTATGIRLTRCGVFLADSVCAAVL